MLIEDENARLLAMVGYETNADDVGRRRLVVRVEPRG
jgi:hypothetical protein